jgi:hypothetical protein
MIIMIIIVIVIWFWQHSQFCQHSGQESLCVLDHIRVVIIFFLSIVLQWPLKVKTIAILILSKEEEVV